MKKSNVFASFFATLCAVSMALAQGPGGQDGNQPGGSSSGGSLAYDDFISIATNASCLVREGTLYGYTSSLTASVAPTASSTVSALATGVFAGNTSITTVDLSNTSITEVPSDCFAGCTALTSVTLPSSCTTIGANAFAGCSSLTMVTAAGVSAVGHDAFRDCILLAEFQPAATVFGPYSFANTSLAGVNLHGVTAGAGAFSLCSTLTVALNIPAEVPDALFAGDNALATVDLSDCTSFGTAALAGCDALTALTLSPSATVGDYALAADEATVVTTLSQSSLPAYADTSFLGREVSYVPVAGSVTRIEAKDLVDWLSDVTASVAVTQPADYGTATLKKWLSDPENAQSYAYAAQIASAAASCEAFCPLGVNGTGFLFAEPDSGICISVYPVGSYTLSSDDLDWTVGNLTWSAADDAYVATDATQPSCFARLSFTWDW